MTRDVSILVENFLREFDEPQSWHDGDVLGAKDSQEVAHQFLGYALASGFLAQNVTVQMHLWDAVLPQLHTFTVLMELGIGIDWTARQFYHAQSERGSLTLDLELIPCPLIFAWPGQYGVLPLVAEEVDRWPSP